MLIDVFLFFTGVALVSLLIRDWTRKGAYILCYVILSFGGIFYSYGHSDAALAAYCLYSAVVPLVSLFENEQVNAFLRFVAIGSIGAVGVVVPIVQAGTVPLLPLALNSGLAFAVALAMTGSLIGLNARTAVWQRRGTNFMRLGFSTGCLVLVSMAVMRQELGLLAGHAVIQAYYAWSCSKFYSVAGRSLRKNG